MAPVCHINRTEIIMSRLITVHNTADEPIYDIVIEKDFFQKEKCTEVKGEGYG